MFVIVPPELFWKSIILSMENSTLMLKKIDNTALKSRRLKLLYLAFILLKWNEIAELNQLALCFIVLRKIYFLESDSH